MRNLANTPSTPLEQSAAGFVLAGGRSSRMGKEKALQLFGGISLLEVALQTLAEAQLPARIAGFRSALGSYAKAVPDTIPDSGPMGGVHAALAASHAEWNLFLPVDLPLMPASLLASLVRRAQLTGCPVTVACLNGRVQPFPAVVHASALPGIVRRLAARETACHAAWRTIPAELGATLDAVAVESLLQCGQCGPGRGRMGLPPVLWFQSANTPEELARLNALGDAHGYPRRCMPRLSPMPPDPSALQPALVADRQIRCGSSVS